MADLTDSELRKGLESTKNFTGFFTLPAFRELCRITPDDLGLPDPVTAYREACCKQSPWSDQQWSHPAAHAAALVTGLFELHTLTEKDCLPMFKRNYEIMIRRVMAGENLDIPVLKALPETVVIPTTTEEGKRRCSMLREML